MNNFMRYKDYFGTVQYSDADGLLYGKIAGITDLVSYDGESLNSLKKNFREAVDDYLGMCIAEGFEPEKTSTDILRKMIKIDAEKLINQYIAV